MAAGNTGPSETLTAEPPPDCALCARLVAFRKQQIATHPGWFNGAVPSFGDERARLLIVGLAPGLQGANKTGRPFTGDYAGDLLYETIGTYGFSKGSYGARENDGLVLVDCMITNAVRCVPPQNKPTAEEIKTCRPFLNARISALKNLSAILVLGRIAHEQTLNALGFRKSLYPFSHGAKHDIGDGRSLYDSYHCSRYNTNTGRLTAEMFQSVFAAIRSDIGSSRL